MQNSITLHRFAMGLQKLPCQTALSKPSLQQPLESVLGRVDTVYENKVPGCAHLQGKQYWADERRLCKAMLSHGQVQQPSVAFDYADVHQTSEAKSFDYRASRHTSFASTVQNREHIHGYALTCVACLRGSKHIYILAICIDPLTLP